MGSGLRQTLGHGMQDTYSEITIQHLNTQGGYLHSHAPSCPRGSGQQQITLDENNLWRVLNATVDGSEQYDHEHKSIDVVTDRVMHSHGIRPLVTDVGFQNEVSAYGMAGFVGDIKDD
ncbi:hypothetical protein M405DRAFT_820562 [Rhizopogon salebrosus TDB-379]|nr:hypothetical protein M405DRAFT_820562 [Rhizopogon salebrosus TDB-379]